MALSPGLLWSLLAATLAAPAEVVVVSEPAGAEVWVAGQMRGRTAPDGLRLRDLEPGPVRIVLRLSGYRDAERTVEAAAGVPRQVRVALRKRAARKGAVVGIAAGAVAGGAGALLLSRTDPLEVDDDGDGVSEEQGDCDDSDAAVSPNGAFTISVRPGLSGPVTCTTPTQIIEIRASNLTCSEVGISRATLASRLDSGGCGGGQFTIELPVSPNLVFPGARDLLVSSRFFAGPSGCCPGGDCGPTPTSCTWGEVYTLTTTLGDRTFTANYTMLFPAGRSCPACASGAVPVEAQRVPH